MTHPYGDCQRPPTVRAQDSGQEDPAFTKGSGPLCQAGGRLSGRLGSADLDL